MPHRLLLGAVLVLLFSSPAVQAHHGDEFMLLEDYELPELWKGLVSSGFDWARYDGLDTFSTESSVFISIAPRVGFSIGSEFNDEGDGWRYAQVTPRLHFQLTPPDAEFPLHLGFSIGYQFVDGAAGFGTKRVRVVTYETQDCGCGGSSLGTVSVVTTSTTSSSSSGPPPCDPLVDVDCPAAPSPKPAPKHAGHSGTTVAPTVVTTVSGGGGSSKKGKTKTVRKVTYETVPEAPGYEGGGIHNHDDNLWTARFVAELDLGSTRILLNLLGLAPEGRGPSWGYAAGIRQQLTHSLGVGLESMGDFSSEGLHEMVLACYFSPAHSVTLKLGAGLGLTDASPDFTLRTGLVWRF